MRNNFFKIVFLTFIFATLSFGTSFTNAHASANDSLVTTEYTLYDNLTSIEQENLIEKAPTSTVTHDKENFKLVFKKADSVTNSILPINNTKLELPQKISKTSSATLPKTGAMKNNILISLLGFSVLILALFLLIWKRKYLKTFLSLLLVLGGSNLFITYDEAHANEGMLPTIDSTILTKGSNYTPNVDLAGYKYIGYLHTYSNDNEPFEKEGQVIVKYKNSNGDTLSKDIILKGNIGDSYVAEQKSFEEYTFKNVIGNTSGKFTEALQTVTFIFEKKPLITGNITVSYQDTNGNKLSEDITLTGAIGDSYTADKKTFDGYTFKNVIGNISGKFEKKPQTVTFIFEKNPIPTSTVTVSYQDTDGNKLSEDIILTGTIGDSYTADKKTFDGYTFDTVKGSSTGTYLNESQTVVFIYKKEPVPGNITLKQSGFINATDRGYIKPNFYKVTYYDKAGNILKTEEIDKNTTLSDETISTNVGSEYTVYSKVTYECYSIDTGERLVWGDYELVANDPELTSGILKEPNLTIEYTFKDLSWA
ncbi:TPA: MucBP domain-containing protein [Enterococcus faecalis]|nr:MucBP domain-containing protein [Enterococcus faecalis]